MKQQGDWVAGAILAGGQSSRMGQDKALMQISGRPMIEIVADTMREVFDEVCVVAAQAEKYRFLGLPVFPDCIPLSGPLGGIHAALSHTTATGVFVCACDTPLIVPALLRYLLARHSRGRTTIAVHNRQIQPLCGIYERASLPVIEEFLKSARLKMSALLSILNAEEVPITPDLPFYAPGLFDNGNEPDSFDRIARNFRT